MTIQTDLDDAFIEAGHQIKSIRTSTTPVIRWVVGVGWERSRPVGAPFGVLYLSTNAVSATSPSDAIDGDIWERHPNAV